MRTPTIGQLIERRQRLHIWCCRPGCRRHTILTPETAAALLGADATFEAARARLRCRVCGASGARRLVDLQPSIEDYYATLREAGLMGRR